MPEGVIFLMTLLPESATKILSLLSTAIPKGKLKEAAVPVPSTAPELPLPARVVTTPADVTFLIR